MKSVRVVIFAKAPLPGLAKTRLIPSLGEHGAAQLAQRMLEHALAQAIAAQVGPVELCVTPAASAAEWRGIVIPAGIIWSDQGEGDLGLRMARVAQRVTASGEAVLLTGTDCPTLDAPRLRRAAAALQRVDATLIPTVDGGYVLLGLNRFDPSLFEEIDWSTDRVAEQTRARIACLGWTLQNDAEVRDIDEPCDLRWLPLSWSLAWPDSGARVRARES